MTTLVATISKEKGVLAHLERVISGEQWSKVVLVGVEKVDIKGEYVSLDPTKTLTEWIEQLKGAFKSIIDTEVGVNLICGSGKEHMAVLSALLKSGLGVRLIALTKEGVKEV